MPQRNRFGEPHSRQQGSRTFACFAGKNCESRNCSAIGSKIHHGVTEGTEQDVCWIGEEWIEKYDPECPQSKIFSVPSVTPWSFVCLSRFIIRLKCYRKSNLDAQLRTIRNPPRIALANRLDHFGEKLVDLFGAAAGELPSIDRRVEVDSCKGLVGG